MSAFFGTVLINADNHGLTVDSGACELTSGVWYGWHPTSALSACDMLASVITANSVRTVTASVSADGFLTLAGDGAFSVEDFDAHDVFGFTSDSLTGASSYVADSRLLASWIPGREPSDSLAPLDEGYATVTLVAQDEAADRSVYTTKIGEQRRQTLRFDFVSQAKAWRTSRSGAVDWWETCDDGRAMVYVPGWTGTSGGPYSVFWVYRLDLKATPSLEPKREQRTAPTSLYWTVELQLRAA